MANKVPGIPSLNQITDPAVRSVLDSLINGWRLRNGDTGSGDDKFLTREDLLGLAASDSEFAGLFKNAIGLPSTAGNTRGGFQDIDSILAGLTGLITESQLFKDLGERIDLIDAPENVARSVNNRLKEAVSALIDRVQKEADARIEANRNLAQELADRADGLADDIFNEAIARENAIIAARDGLTAVLSSEMSARIENDTAIANSVTQLAAKTDGAVAGVSDRINVVASAQNATASRVSELAAQVGNNAAAITTEQNVRATADSSLATRIDTTTATLDGKIAAVRSTTTANATQLETLAKKIDEIIVVDQGQAAAITVEQMARIAADGALSSRIESLSARTDKNASDIVNEAKARTDADSATATTLSALTTRVGSAEAAIVTERTTRATNDNALSSSITGITSRLGAAEAAIVEERTTRATADSSQASSISGLTTRVGAAETNIVSLRTADTTNFNALLSSIDQKIASFNNNTVQAGFSALENARVTGDTAITNSLTQQFSSVNGNLAALSTKVDTAANSAAAAVTKVDQVAATVGGFSTAIQTEQQARINADNTLFAQYTVKIDDGDRVIGFGLASTGPRGNTTGSFIVRADSFAVAAPGSPGYIPFTVQTRNTTLPNGTVVPPGVYMDRTVVKELYGGYIQGTEINAGLLDANKILTNSRYLDRYAFKSLNREVVIPATALLSFGPASYGNASSPSFIGAFYNHFFTGVPENLRLASDKPVQIVFTASGVVDHYMSLWFNENGSGWRSLGAITSPAPGDGAVSLTVSGVVVPPSSFAYSISFGVASSNGFSVLNPSKPYILDFSASVTAQNL